MKYYKQKIKINHLGLKFILMLILGMLASILPILYLGSDAIILALASGFCVALPYTLGMFPKYLCSLVMHKALPYTLGMFQYLILYLNLM